MIKNVILITGLYVFCFLPVQAIAIAQKDFNYAIVVEETTYQDNDWGRVVKVLSGKYPNDPGSGPGKTWLTRELGPKLWYRTAGRGPVCGEGRRSGPHCLGLR